MLCIPYFLRKNYLADVSISNPGVTRTYSRAALLPARNPCRALNPAPVFMRRFLRSLSIMTRPPNWKARAPFPPAGNVTYAEQESLPTLPVPTLQSTLQKLKVSLKPLAKSGEEYNTALKRIDAFAAGAGPTLQKRLEARAAEPGREHWLEEWWDELAYMGYRDSVSLSTAIGIRSPPLSPFIGRNQRLVLLYVDQ